VTPLPLGAIGSGGWRTLAHLLALANRVHPSIGTNGTLPAGFAVPVLVSTQEDLDDPDQPDQPAHPSHPDYDKPEHDKPEHDAYQCAGDDHGDDD